MSRLAEAAVAFLLIFSSFFFALLYTHYWAHGASGPPLPSAVSISVVDRCNSGKADMVKKFSEWLMEKYRNMTGDYPALCPGFYVELAKLPSGYAGFAHFSYSGGRACVSLIQIACDMDEFSTKMALAHEFGHAMQATYLRDASSFSGWVVEAVPEAAATHVMGQVMIQMPWHSFWFTKAYYTEQLYKRNPWDCRQGSPNYCEYKYSGAVGWLFERYGYRSIY
ncbi:hypothetical protein, partial [Pyrobaculum sp.]|uniref:hypothetical protein n=1 Tax=Pyrobaculum sp. TaxID=2004705 RepID=UPI003D0DCD24